MRHSLVPESVAQLWKLGLRKARALGAVAALASASCAEIAGFGDYGIQAEPSANPCDDLEAMGPDGECAKVGVRSCGKEFLEDGRGGCEPKLPAEDCGPGQLAPPGKTGCGSRHICPEGRFWQGGVAGMELPTLRYVEEAAAPGGDGSEQYPFRTLREAIDSVAPEPGTILLSSGAYEGAVISSRMDIWGKCPAETQILPGPSGAAFSFRVGADGSSVQRLSIGEGNVGISVDGSTDVHLLILHIHDIEGPGVVIEDSLGPASASLSGTLIEDTAGSAVISFGSDVQISGVAIRRAALRASSELDAGIAIHPSAKGKDPWHPRRPMATIEGSLVQETRGAGLLFSGVDAVVDEVVVRDIAPDDEGRGRGIVVDRRLGGLVPASVRVTQSLIERVADVGILASDLGRPVNEDTVALDPGVNLDVVDSVVRDVASSAGPGESCHGNGIRVRSTGKADRPDSVMLTVQSSLVERTREAGIHVQGARAQISSTIVRDVSVDSCSGRFGDAIAAYAQPEMPTEVSIESSLLEGAERASVALFDATADIRGVVASCNGAPVVTSRSFGESAATIVTSWCGCGEARRACERVDDELEAALHGRRGCDPDDDKVCFHGVADDFFSVIQGAENPLSGVTAWTLDDLSVAPAVSDKLGRFELGGLPPRADLLLIVAAEAYMPIVLPMRTGSNDSVPWRAPMPPSFAADTVAALYSARLDFRKAFMVTDFVCHAPEGLAEGETFVPCVGRGFRGVTMDLSPRAAGGPVYISPGGFPELQLTSITENAGAAFVNAAAGDATLSWTAPGGQNGFECSLDAFGDGWFADEITPPFILREHFIAGANNVRFIFCRAGN